MAASERTKQTALAVMAKAPQSGRSKTRLSPVLGLEGAAQLSAAFLRDVTENIALAARDYPIAGYVAYAPSGGEALFDGMLAEGTRLVLADGDRELSPRVQGFGRCLLHAAQALDGLGHHAVCLVNSDSPNLPTGYLRRAVAALALAGDRVVLGPAEDGGYYLIGLKRPHAQLFEDIAWSTEQVAEQTRERAAEAGLELVELPPWYDVDDEPSLDRLCAELRSTSFLAYPAPATAACLVSLGRFGFPQAAQ